MYAKAFVDIERENNAIIALAKELTYKRQGFDSSLSDMSQHALIDFGDYSMTFEKLLSNINYNIKKILEELREKIKDGLEINEIIDDRQIIYQHSGEDFCLIKIKKDYLEIDFIADNRIADPMEFSWKLRPTKKYEFNRRMQIKNISDIDMVFGLIFQSYNFQSSTEKK